MEDNLSPQTTNDLFKSAARSGAINGAIGIFITILLYVINYELLVSLKVLLVLLVLFLGLVIYQGIQYRVSIGGYLPFGKAFQHGFITLVVGGLIGILFSLVLYNLIDSELPQKLTDVTVLNTEEMMKNFGAQDAQIDEAVKKVKIETPDRFTLLGQAKQFAWGLIFNAVIALITGAIVKRNQPVEML